MAKKEAYVTLLVTDSYAPGALVLAQRLRELGTTRELAVMVTGNVTSSIREQISLVFDSVIDIDKLDSGQKDELALLGRPELGVTFSKLQLWLLEEYSKVVFLDADVLPLRLVDELFDRPEFSAAPDAGWPDCFNSGVFVAIPNKDTYAELCDLATSKGSFDGGDQGILNTYFDSWSTSPSEHRLPFIYNTTPTAVYSYVPAYQVNRGNIAIAHFIGTIKPWHSKPSTSSQADKSDLVQQWWNVYNRYYGDQAQDVIEQQSESFSIAVAAPVYDPAVPPRSQIQPVFPWEQNPTNYCTRVWYD
ncbi:glycogenin glucosyltransferase [Umbelopsis nana]